MYEYDSSLKILRCFKLKEQPKSINLLKVQKDSYLKYIADTVYTDIESFAKVINKIVETKGSVSFENVVVSAESDSDQFERETLAPISRFYAVHADVSIYHNVRKNMSVQPNVLLFKIPFMNDDGILDVNEAKRVVINKLVPATVPTYDADKQVINVQLPERNIAISLAGKAITVKYGSDKAVPFHDFVIASFAQAGYAHNITKYLCSASALTAIGDIDYKIAASYLADSKLSSMLTSYSGDAYTLGSARQALNTLLTIDRALQHTLSRPAGTFPAGTLVTESVLYSLKKQLVNEVYIQDKPSIVGYILDMPLFITTLKKGMHVGKYLRTTFNLTHIDADTPCTIGFNVGTKITEDILEFIYDVGVPVVKCKRTASSPSIRCTFEREIIGNYTCPLYLVIDNPPEGRSYDEYVYYYNNPTFEKNDPDHLTPHDLLALLSLASYVKETGDSTMLKDKDLGFQKRLLSVSEIFSQTIRYVFSNFIRKRSKTRSVRNAIDNGGGFVEIFAGFTKEWTSYMYREKYITLADPLNPCVAVTQVNIAESHVQGQIPDNIRQMAMGSYGRICPYETPSSLKIGVVNTLATQVHVAEDGSLLAPYRQVITDTKGHIISVSDQVTYMTVEEESEHVIGDLLSVFADSEYVQARIPADGGGQTISTVHKSQLEYVNAWSEQALSPTVSLIPFACHNDATRVTYASNMLKQSISVQPETYPRVFTSMYKDIFNHSDTYVVRARKDGKLMNMPGGRVMVQYDDEQLPEFLSTPETVIDGEFVNFLTFKVGIGEHFKKGDIIADSAVSKEGFYSPGIDCLVAYIPTGYNYEDAVDMSEGLATRFTSISNTSVKVKVHKNDHITARSVPSKMNMFVPEGTPMGSIRITTDRDYRRAENIPVVSDKASGILFYSERDFSDREYYSYKYHLLSLSRLSVGDKIAGRHSNKGTDARIRANSEMPCFRNGVPIEMCLNPLGVPSRMNSGQNFEGFMGFVATLLDIHIQSDPFNGASKEEVAELLHYVWDLCNNDDYFAVIAKYPNIPVGLHNQAACRHDYLLSWKGCFNPDGTACLWNPVSGEYFENPVTIGVSHFLKLHHEVRNKVNARSGLLEEDYALVSKQPVEGAARGGGQKMGEMELLALAQYGADALLEETLNEDSDNTVAKANMVLDSVNRSDYLVQGNYAPHATYALKYYLEALGIKIEGLDFDPDPPVMLDVKGLLKRNRMPDSFETEGEDPPWEVEPT